MNVGNFPMEAINLVFNSALGSALGTAFITSIAKLTWDFIKKLEKRFEEQASVFVFEKPIPLGLCEEVLNYGKFYYLLIRYGTDQYIRDMASDEERWIGRLRNEIYALKAEEGSSGQIVLNLKLKVHRRLGTQFKVFFELDSRHEDKLDRVEAAFSESGLEYSFASSPAGKHRIFFILKDFGTVTTVDGLKNNMCFPI